ncbi:hypothetical protein GOBAR_DD11860 [Gossypium barbadense]|nr:hypothetical protein GOBAR_DD11860 [Gossypium barbadense]
MNEEGYDVDNVTCNIVIDGLCKSGKLDKAMEIAHEMWTHGPREEAGLAKGKQEAFVSKVHGGAIILLSHSISALCKAEKIDEAKNKFREMTGKNFLYKDLIEKLCKDGKLEKASGILHKLIIKGYKFDPASFMPGVDDLGKRGNKHEADELAEKMLQMASDGRVENKISRKPKELIHRKEIKYGGDDWQTIVHRYG